MFNRILPIFLLFSIIISTASAWEFVPIEADNKYALHLNGLTYHFCTDRDDLNETNWGLGIEYDLYTIESSNKLFNGAIIALEADAYSDSFSESGYAFGAIIQQNVCSNLDFGLRAGFIHEANLQEKSGYYLFPYLLPYLQTSFDSSFNYRLTYVPPVQSNGFLALQVIVDL